MATDGRLAFAGAREIAGNYNAYPAIGDVLVYLKDTAVGDAFGAGAFGNIASILIPRAGIWDLYGQVDVAATTSETATTIALSIYSANTTTDHVTGRNVLHLGKVAAAVGSGAVRDIITVTAAQVAAGLTVYLKAAMATADGDTATGMLICRRLFDVAS